MDPLDVTLNARLTVCQSCYTHQASTSIRLSDGPLRVCAGCEADWHELEGL